MKLLLSLVCLALVAARSKLFRFYEKFVMMVHLSEAFEHAVGVFMMRFKVDRWNACVMHKML